MATIVKYTDTEPPPNEFPRRIVSPMGSGPCCFAAMETVGEVQRDGQWEYRYKRCRTCGYTVRFIQRQMPDEALIVELRKVLAVSFQRNVADAL